MPSGDGFIYAPLATVFPAGLDQETDATELDDGFTPDGIGFSLANPGRLKKSQVPTNVARTNKEVTIGQDTFQLIYERLWKITGDAVEFGAPFYEDIFFRQGLGKVTFPETGGNPVVILPYGGNDIFVGTAGGSYILANTNSRGGRFMPGNLIQELPVAAADNALEINGTVFLTNGSGWFALPPSTTTTQEISRRIRDDTDDLENTQLQADFEKKRIVTGTAAGNQFVFDVESGKIFKYNDDDFRFTSRTFTRRGEGGIIVPFYAQEVMLHVEHVNTTDDKQITLQFKQEDDEWSDDIVVDVPAVDAEETFTTVTAELTDSTMTERIAIRIEDMDDTIMIRAIFLVIAESDFDDFTR